LKKLSVLTIGDVVLNPAEGKNMTKQQIIDLLSKAEEINIDTIKTENLYAFDGKPAFSLGQGQ
jgi:isocitrate dehydrogenase